MTTARTPVDAPQRPLRRPTRRPRPPRRRPRAGPRRPSSPRWRARRRPSATPMPMPAGGGDRVLDRPPTPRSQRARPRRAPTTREGASASAPGVVAPEESSVSGPQLSQPQDGTGEPGRAADGADPAADTDAESHRQRPGRTERRWRRWPSRSPSRPGPAGGSAGAAHGHPAGASEHDARPVRRRRVAAARRDRRLPAVGAPASRREPAGRGHDLDATTAVAGPPAPRQPLPSSTPHRVTDTPSRVSRGDTRADVSPSARRRGVEHRPRAREEEGHAQAVRHQGCGVLTHARVIP